MTLSLHQKRILAALYELGATHELRLWDRNSIGRVVDAGGFHQVIQVRSMEALRNLGLALTERESWPLAVQQMVQCNCACYCWGLTRRGVEIAEELSVTWSPEAKGAIARCGIDKRMPEYVVTGEPVERSRWRRYPADGDDFNDDVDGDV